MSRRSCPALPVNHSVRFVFHIYFSDKLSWATCCHFAHPSEFACRSGLIQIRGHRTGFNMDRRCQLNDFGIRCEAAVNLAELLASAVIIEYPASNIWHAELRAK